ncbi:MAG: hypothetical protein ACFB12_06970 [Leptolyngbyaceae cyanobacterium]
MHQLILEANSGSRPPAQQPGFALANQRAHEVSGRAIARSSCHPLMFAPALSAAICPDDSRISAGWHMI